MAGIVDMAFQILVQDCQLLATVAEAPYQNVFQSVLSISFANTVDIAKVTAACPDGKECCESLKEKGLKWCGP